MKGKAMVVLISFLHDVEKFQQKNLVSSYIDVKKNYVLH